MKKAISTLISLIIFVKFADAIPHQITYQGTLKQIGAPVNKTLKMRFRLTDKEGASSYWVSKVLPVKISAGLFSQVLDIDDIDLQKLDPYMEVTISLDETSEPNIVMLPREPVTANLYSLVSASVVDNSITMSKVAKDIRDALAPSGMIAMFNRACPDGWVRFSELDGRFPFGGNTYGVLGGSLRHTHDILPHRHKVSDSNMSIEIGLRNISDDRFLVMRKGNAVGAFSSATASEWFGYATHMDSPAPIGTNPADVAVSGPKIEGATLDSEKLTTTAPTSENGTNDSLPPYYTVLFCLKT